MARAQGRHRARARHRRGRRARRCRGARCAPPPTRGASPASRPPAAGQLWARELSSLTGVSLDARYAFVADERGAVHALDRSNGAVGLEAGQARPPPAVAAARRAARRWRSATSRATCTSWRATRARSSRATRPAAARCAPRRCALPAGLLVQTRGRRPVRPRRREAGHRPGRAAERRQVDPLQPPHAQPRRHRARPAGRDARPALRRRPPGRARLHRHRHRRLRAGAAEGIFVEMARQAEQAIAEADAVVFVVDGRAGLAPGDRAIAEQAAQG